MGTFKGKDYRLQFGCSSCGQINKKYCSTITIDPARDEDMRKLQTWLLTHSEDGGVYSTVFHRHNAEAIQMMIDNGWQPVGDVGSRDLRLRKDGIEIDSRTIEFV